MVIVVVVIVTMLITLHTFFSLNYFYILQDGHLKADETGSDLSKPHT